MLLHRVITALVLLVVLLPAIFIAPPWVWGLVSLAFLAVGTHEWAQLLAPLPAPATAQTGTDRAAPAAGARGWPMAMVLVLAGLLILWWRQQHEWPAGVLGGLMAGLSLFWLIGGTRRLVRHDARGGGPVLAAALLLGCWLALYELRLQGTFALISSMAVIWVADIAAYFVGRAFGRRKLAPAISPGKSWEGAWGGAAAVVVIGLGASALSHDLWPALAGSLPARLVGSLGAVAAGLILIAMAALSVVGDLHESLLKRQAGVKDSGWILPGHGGVLDRIDALIPTMPLAMLVYELLT